MTRKNATSWDRNTAKLDGVAYSSASVTYNSSTTAYSSSTTALAEDGQLPAAWVQSTKIGSNWETNPAAIVNEYAYDSATDPYDSAVQTYDGIVVGQDNLNQSVPALWAELGAS